MIKSLGFKETFFAVYKKGRDRMKARLILEDGTVFEGRGFGSEREVITEIVFNTSMTGYLEVLTDPSYAGQGVVMTYPMIGNYGVCRDDMQSKRAWPDAFIVREYSDTYSNFRAEEGLEAFLKEFDIPALQGIDTRALVKRLRDKGTMNGLLTRSDEPVTEEMLERIRAYRVSPEVVRTVSTKEIYEAGNEENPEGPLVALMDYGTKKNIVKSLVVKGCRVRVYPCDTKAEDVLKDKPQGIMLSNGPGDPADFTFLLPEIRVFVESGLPMFAICLGHQLMALTRGAKTYKMKYGHRGGNHPVKNLETGRTYITSQNHGYCVDASSFPEGVARTAFQNVNDKTNEGLYYPKEDILSVQFHPEASPGPGDSGTLFEDFVQKMERRS